MTSNIVIPKDYDVYWEKWIDPYEDSLSMDSETEDENNYLDDDDEDINNLMDNFSENELKSLLTPFGVLPLTEQSLASKHFKLWTGHTNFKFTQDFCEVIRQINGVETADIVTNYRFRIGIAKLFSDRSVMHNAKKKLIIYAKELYGSFNQE